MSNGRSDKKGSGKNSSKIKIVDADTYNDGAGGQGWEGIGTKML